MTRRGALVVCSVAIAGLVAAGLAVAGVLAPRRQTSMFSASAFSHAIDRFEREVGPSAQLLDVAVSSHAIAFLYVRDGREVTYTVTAPGSHARTGSSFVLGGHEFSLSAVRPAVLASILHRIRLRHDVGRFTPEIAAISYAGTGAPAWEVLGVTRSRFFVLRADERGRHLRVGCVAPVMRPKQPISC